MGPRRVLSVTGCGRLEERQIYPESGGGFRKRLWENIVDSAMETLVSITTRENDPITGGDDENDPIIPVRSKKKTNPDSSITAND